jgi:hypothetical protein
VLRQEVAANRKTIASAGTLARKRKNENVNGEIDANAIERYAKLLGQGIC